VILLKLSARNKFKGTVEDVEVGPIMANVKIKIEAPNIVTAIITKESINDLNIKEGDTVIAIIKSTEVMVAKD
jgi:molybdopterin-binding protein